MGFALSGGLFSLGLGDQAVGAEEMGVDANKPQVGKADVAVTVAARLLGYLRPVVLVGTILLLCLAIYAVSVALIKR